MEKDENLTKTRALTELETLKEEGKEEIEVENPEFVDSEEVTKEFTIKDKKKKESIIDKFKKLPKKNKIIIIVSGVIVLLLAIGLILFFVLRKEEGKEDDTPKEEVIVNESTYTYKNGTLIIYDSNKNTLGEYECTNKDEELCYVAYYENNLDDFNTTEIYKEDEILLDRSTNYGDLIFIYDNSESKDGEIILYNLKDKKELAKYKNIKKVNDELVIVNDDNYKLVSLKDNSVTTIVEDSYNYMAYESDFKTERIVVGKNSNYYLIDFTGKVLTSKLDYNIVMYNDSYVVLRNSDAYKVVDYKNKAIVEDSEYIELYDKFMVSIENQKLYLKSYEGFSYNIDGIKLSTTSYKPTKKYDKDDNLVEEEKAYNLEINGNTVVVHLDNEEKTIDLLEGENSKAKNYYSYSDGKLYFYSDEEKKELIGFYPCDNKNTFSNSDGIFKSCDVAVQSNFSNNYKTSDTSFGLVPIYYNRYVFVSDNSSLTSDDAKIIYLYDLKNKRKVGSYNEVDAGTKENFGNVNVDTNILAKNKDGKFGMITLKSDGVSATYRSDYNFKVTKMERFGNDVIVEKDGKWEVLSSDGTSKGGFKGKILDYLDKYFIIEDNTKVRVYNLEGLKDIGNDAYDYVKLTTSFYIYVNNNNLGVKNYEGKSLLLDDDNITVPVAITDYNKSLRISIVGSNGTISILNGNNEVLETHTFSTKVSEEKEDKPVEKEEDKTEETDAN